jgi:hypothetical protein
VASANLSYIDIRTWYDGGGEGPNPNQTGDGNYSFSPTTYYYGSVNVYHDLNRVTITPTGYAGNIGTITVQGVVVASGAQSGYIATISGSPVTITIVHTQTGRTPKTYTIVNAAYILRSQS